MSADAITSSPKGLALLEAEIEVRERLRGGTRDERMAAWRRRLLRSPICAPSNLSIGDVRGTSDASVDVSRTHAIGRSNFPFVVARYGRHARMRKLQ